MARGKLHLAGVLGLVAAMLLSLAMVASAAMGKNGKASAAQYQYKVTICHRTKSKKKPFHTIRVAAAAVPAHLKHGDTLGACPTADEHAATSATSSTSGKSKKNKSKGNEAAATNSGSQAGGNGNGKAKGKNK